MPGHIEFLCELYPSLTTGLIGRITSRWKEGVADDIVARFGQEPLDGSRATGVLRESAVWFAKVHPQGADRLEGAFRQWLNRAEKAQTDELNKQPLGDWTAPDSTIRRRGGTRSRW